MPDRFLLLDDQDVIIRADNAEDWLYGYDDDLKTFVFDTWTNEVVFSDGFEPEDANLSRGFAPLIDMLNLAYAGQDE